MRSAARLTYDGSGRACSSSPRPRGKHAELKPALEHLHAVYEAFAQARKRRGAIDFDLPETKIELDEQRQGRERARRRAARDAQDHRRMHDRGERRVREAHAQGRRSRACTACTKGPTKSGSRSSCCSCARFGSQAHRRAKFRRKRSTASSRASPGKPEAELDRDGGAALDEAGALSAAERRPLRLGARAYAHFTSPIRRYPDLLVHRAINGSTRSARPRASATRSRRWSSLGEHCSRTERRADEATREVAERLKCIYLEGSRRRDVRRGRQRASCRSACSCACRSCKPTASCT